MKNIHIIPTDKLSRLFIAENDIEMFILSDKYELGNKLCKNQHIYITNDEEIKGGDWCLDKFNQRWKLEDKKLIGFDNKGIKRFSTDNILGHECKKIILTTDQDLIKDGVQAIDDEFLEWFVKNPSCERVGVEKEYNEERIVDGKDIGDYSYKIIIPQEEPKQIKCYCGHTIICDCEPLQETIEEPKK
jgi:hypothetical protein